MTGWKDHGPGGCCCGCFSLSDDFLDSSFSTGEMQWNNRTNWVNGFGFARNANPDTGIVDGILPIYPQSTLPGNVRQGLAGRAFVWGTVEFDVLISDQGLLTVFPNYASNGYPVPCVRFHGAGLAYVAQYGQINSNVNNEISGFYPTSEYAAITPASESAYTVKMVMHNRWYEGTGITFLRGSSCWVYTKSIGSPDSDYTAILAFMTNGVFPGVFVNTTRYNGHERLIQYSPVPKVIVRENGPAPAPYGFVQITNYKWTASQLYYPECERTTIDYRVNWLTPGETDPATCSVYFNNMAKSNLNLLFNLPQGNQVNTLYQTPNVNHSNMEFFTDSATSDVYHLIWRQTGIEFYGGSVYVTVLMAFDSAVAVPTPTDGSRIKFVFAYSLGTVPNNSFPVTFSIADCYQIEHETRTGTAIGESMYAAMFSENSTITITPT